MKVKVRKATMTNKERMEALLRREKPDRVPFWGFSPGSFAAVYLGWSIADTFTRPPKEVYEAQKKTCRDFDWVLAPNLITRRNFRPFGGELKLPTNQYSQAQYVTEYAVKTAEDVMALKVPDVTECITPKMLEFSKWVYQDKDENKPFLTIGGLSVMNQAAGIAGYDKLCQWMLKAPEVARRLIRLAADYEIATVQYVKDTFGVDRLVASGANAAASNQLISPQHFQQFALPYLKEVHEKILAMGFKHMRQHPCGEQNLNMPYWQQIPIGDPGIFYVGNEIDLETAAKYFPNDIIEGNLDTTIIQIGTPEEVYQASRKVIEQGRSLPNGFILGPACSLPPRASVDNMRAITRALNDFGWYD